MWSVNPYRSLKSQEVKGTASSLLQLRTSAKRVVVNPHRGVERLGKIYRKGLAEADNDTWLLHDFVLNCNFEGMFLLIAA